MPRPLPITSESPALAEPAESRRDQLVRMIPGLEIVMARALGAGDDARDGVQEVLARALRALNGGSVIRESLESFVHGIAAHVIADARRSQRKMPVTSIDGDALPARSPDALELIITGQERQAMRDALARLDPADLDLLRRCFVDGEKTSAIAQRAGVPPSRVRKQKSRAIDQLRALLNAVRSRRHTSPRDATNRP